MGRPTFIDAHKAFNASGYDLTNEEISVHNMLLDGAGLRRFMKGAAIASGGEIPLAVLLHRCDQLICVDHSYRSCAMTMLKASLIDTMGPRAFLALIMEGEALPLSGAIKSVWETLPIEVRKTGASPAPTMMAPAIDDYSLRSWRREWHEANQLDVEEAAKKLHRVTIIHGDLEDLKEHGPFDVLYASNAMEHSGRGGKVPKMSLFGELLKDGGYLLATGGSSPFRSASVDPSWTHLKQIHGFRTSWDHHLIRWSAPTVQPSAPAPAEAGVTAPIAAQPATQSVGDARKARAPRAKKS